MLTYAKVEWKVTDSLTWSNQAYYHYNYGRGLVAGAINQAGLPGLFAAYFPQLVVDKNGNSVPATQAAANTTTPGTLANIAKLFGGSGYDVRATEYRINREGILSTANLDLGKHRIEAGLWVEHNEPAEHRTWYPMTAANNDLSPYTVPKGHVFTQYFAQLFVNDVQLHAQDQWRVLPNLLLQAGWKASLQTATGNFPINQVNPASIAPTSPSYVVFPHGTLTSNEWFLPQVGAVWDVTSSTQAFFNVQKNMRQFVPYGAGSNFYAVTPFSLGTQAAFDLFKQTIHPETAWTYELGLRTKMVLDNPVVTAFEGQVNYYHVSFANRLFNVAPYNFLNPAPSIIVNVGGVRTDGVDAAGTLHFGRHFSAYEALSYNKSTYDSNYANGLVNGVANIVPIAGKSVPLTPDWTSKTILSTSWGAFEAQLNGDYIGRRYVTYLNDLSVPSTFVMGLEASYRFEMSAASRVKSARISANVTNLGDRKGISTAVVTGASGGYQAFPLSPRMFFMTLAATF